MKFVVRVVVAVLLLVCAGSLEAQILTGSLIGSIKDESGAVLPGVTLTLSSPVLPTGSMTAVTDGKGEYRFPRLPAGEYGLTVSIDGFASYKEEGLRVNVGGTIERDVTMKLASVSESVTVSGQSPMIDPQKVGVTANLATESLETLPRNRNAIYELMKWSPGVAPPDPSAGSGGSVMGAGTGENSNLMDGIMTNNPVSGGGWSSGDVDGMQEIQILTLGAPAEYQVAQGGVFNIVLKSGTNNFRGSGSGYWYPDSLLSRPVRLPCNCDLDGGLTGHHNLIVRNYSAHAGGPIRKDRLWYYGGYNLDRRRQGQPGTDPRLIPKLWYSDALIGKVTWQINKAVRFNGTYHEDIYGSQSVPSVSMPFTTINASDAPWLISYAPEVTATLSNTTLLTVRATGWTDRVTAFPYTGNATSPFHRDQNSGIGSGGVPSFGNTSLGRHTQSFKLSHYATGDKVSDDLRFGVQIEEAHAYTFNAFPSGVQYSDLGTQPDQATFRTPYVAGAESKSQGAWVDNQIMAGRLTVSLGVRYDRMRANSPDLPMVDNLIHETGQTISGTGTMFTWNVVAPRVGFNLKLNDATTTVLRGHYGRAYRTIFFNDFDLVYPGLSPVTLARWNPATNSYSTIISVTDSKANLRVDPDIKAPYTDSYSVGMDHQLVANMGIGVTYVHKDGHNQTGWQDIGGVYGTRTDVLPDGRTITVMPLLNAASSRVFLRTNGPGVFTRYNGMVVTFQKRLSHRWNADISYTRSKAEGLTTTAQDPNMNINASGLLSTDRPNLFVASGLFQIPKIDADFSAQLLAVAGTTYAPQALINLPQGRLSINIAPADGTYHVPAQKLLTIRLTKNLFTSGPRRLEVSAAVDNLLQSRGYNSVVSQNFFGTTFGNGSGFIEGRRVNFVARVKF